MDSPLLAIGKVKRQRSPPCRPRDGSCALTSTIKLLMCNTILYCTEEQTSGSNLATLFRVLHFLFRSYLAVCGMKTGFCETTALQGSIVGVPGTTLCCTTYCTYSGIHKSYLHTKRSLGGSGKGAQAQSSTVSLDRSTTSKNFA